jgi:hypothetical protein
MKNFIALFGAVAAASLSTTAYAQDEASSRFSVGITAGSLGIGPEVGFRFSDYVGVRGNATLLSVSHDIDSGNINYDGKVKLKSGGAMVDFYPFKGGFRISGGVRINGNEARAIATPTGTVTVGNTSYPASAVGTLRTETDIKNVAPALTLGYGGGLSKGLVFGVEAGALFQGSVKIKPITYTGSAISAADLEAERRDIQDDIDGYKVYPILQLTLGYRF